MQISPFTIAVPDDAVADLQARLDRARWPRSDGRTGWGAGIDGAYLRSLVADWRAFDWRAREAALNALPQRMTTIDGLPIHFLHYRGRGPAPFPLILTHGWPSSFLEWLELADRLADPGAHGGDPADAFDVIVPSLPGYGFSGVAPTPGMSPQIVATLWPQLMAGLGYQRWGAHGCDIGTHVTAFMGLNAAPGLVGVHMGSVPFLPAAPPKPAAATAEETSYLERAKRWAAQEQGYVAIQGTKPDTLAPGLSDSPIGLAAWIAEKWRAWSDCADEPEAAIPRETLLTNIAIYWFTGTIGPSMRYYHAPGWLGRRLAPGEFLALPCGFFLERPDMGAAPGKLGRLGPPPQAWVQSGCNVKRWHVAPRGGHFPGLEVPDALADELRGFFRALR